MDRYSLSDITLLYSNDYFGKVRNYTIEPTDLQYDISRGRVYDASRHIKMDNVVLGVNAKENEDETELTHRAVTLAVYNSLVALIDELEQVLKRNEVTECKSVIPKSCDHYLRTQNNYYIGIKIENTKWDVTLTAMILCED